MTPRKQYDSRFKTQVAIEAIKNQQTIAQIASQYQVHPNQVSKWKKQVLSELPEIFKNGRKPADLANEQLVAQLYQQIGQLKVELDWLQKKQAFSVEEKRSLVAPSRKILVGHQCEFLRLACCSFYYEASWGV